MMMRLTLCCLLLALAAAALAVPFTPVINPGVTAGRASSSNVNPDANGDSWGFKPGETRVLADLAGPGQINHIWCTVSADEIPVTYSKLVLRMYWDGEPTPSVEAPLGDFFGVGMGQYYMYDCAVFSVGDSAGFNCYWPMPFAKSARVTVTNESDKGAGLYFYVDYQRLPKIDPKLGRFHAQYRLFKPPAKGKDMTLLEATGQGLFVGCNYTIFATTADWWGEGDDKFTIDGKLALKGTGTEDYFCGGWGFPATPRGYAHLYTGVPLNGMCREKEITNCYRYHLTDPVPFAKSLRFDMEHKGAGIVDGKNQGYLERFDTVSTVCYWYQHEPHAAFPRLPALPDRLLDYQKSAYVEPEAVDVERYLAFLTVDGGQLERQRMIAYGNLWSSGEQALLKATGPGARITFPSAPLMGVTGAVIGFTKGPDYGIVAIKQGDQVLATFDGYAPEISKPQQVTVRFPRLLTDAPFVIEVTGKNPAAAGYCVGLDYLKLPGAEI